MQHPDVCIAGAGIIGLSLALELTRRGARVTLLERGPALAEASSAAAGMLAAGDPGNPPLLRPLAELSLRLYPAFLNHLAQLADTRVPFQTELTLQATELPSAASLSDADVGVFLPHHNLAGVPLTLLDEHSIDPRQLADALRAAAANTILELRPRSPVSHVVDGPAGLTVHTAEAQLKPSHFVDCTGAWAATIPGAAFPRKGQMLAVAVPPDAPLFVVLRTDELYIVPRTVGPNAGRAIIGATVEDAGFSKSVDPSAIARLREAATRLLPLLAGAPLLDQWAGLRPATTDELPLLGALPGHPRHLVASGHFRNGILLAPATAHLLAQLISAEPVSLDLEPFAPGRFLPAPVAV